MVKFYAYYSFGGYREFYLGNSQDNYTYSWYFSMLPIWEARLREAENEKLKAQVEEAHKLPKMEDVGKGGANAIPAGASALVSHGGYDVIYRAANNFQVLAVKDIDSKDDTGRPAPFMMLFAAQDAEGIALLDKLAEYLLTNLMAFKEKLAGLFVYDLEKNGLRFDIGQMRTILAEVNASLPAPRVAWHEYYPVHTIITAQKLEITLQNQSISHQDVFYAVDLNGKILEDKQQPPADNLNGQKVEQKKEDPVKEIGADKGSQAKGEVSIVGPVGNSKEQTFCDKATKCAKKVKTGWNGLSSTAKGCIVVAAAILLIALVTPRSCKKGPDKKPNQTSQVIYHEKAL